MSTVIFSNTEADERGYLGQLLKEKEWFEREDFFVFLPKNKKEIDERIVDSMVSKKY